MLYSTHHQEDFLKTEAETLSKRTEAQLQLRSELDQCMRETAEREARRQQQDLAEDKGIQLFQQAKKVMLRFQWWIQFNSTRISCEQRMSRLRKEKEKELFQQFQGQQQRMAELLQGQRQKERDTEDEAITRAMEEQHAKKEVCVCVVYTRVNGGSTVDVNPSSKLSKGRNSCF